MNTLIITVGLPRSGKSTWARSTGYPIVNRDAVRLALHGERFLAAAEPMVNVITHLMVEALFRGGNERVVVDECNVTHERRQAWVNMTYRVGACIHVEIFDTSPEECQRRATAMNDSAILPVIERMAAEWDLPIPKHWRKSW